MILTSLGASFIIASTPGLVRADVGTPDYDPVFYYYHSDHLGSAEIMTDRDGDPVQHYGYQAFGNERYKHNTSAFSVTNRYTGQQLDEDTGLYFYGSRYYDPALARFIQPDSVVPSVDNSQAFNRYSYCCNNPLIFTDPTGNMPTYDFDASATKPWFDFESTGSMSTDITNYKQDTVNYLSSGSTAALVTQSDPGIAASTAGILPNSYSDTFTIDDLNRDRSYNPYSEVAAEYAAPPTIEEPQVIQTEGMTKYERLIAQQRADKAWLEKHPIVPLGSIKLTDEEVQIAFFESGGYHSGDAKFYSDLISISGGSGIVSGYLGVDIYTGQPIESNLERAAMVGASAVVVTVRVATAVVGVSSAVKGLSSVLTRPSPMIYGGTPHGRPYTYHYGVDRAYRGLSGRQIDKTVNTIKGYPSWDNTTVHYDKVKNLTVVTGRGGSIVTAHPGRPSYGGHGRPKP